LEELSKETRDILIWRYVDELSISEISNLSGKKKNAVYVSIHRALREAQKIIKKYEDS